MNTSTKRSHTVWCGISIGSVALVAVLSSLHWMGRSSSPQHIPSPFESNQSFLQGAVTRIGMKNNIPVDEVTFFAGETSEPLAVDTIHFVLTAQSGFSPGAPLSVALTAGKRIFGYEYTPNAELERARQNIPGAPGYPWTFAERFPGKFFASDTQRADGSFIQNFETDNDVTFLPLSQVTLSANARFLVVANDANTAFQANLLTWCGNSAKETPEECDDGDTTSGDGCSSGCFVEDGFSCSNDSPNVCQLLCSNGLTDLNGEDEITGNADDEQCDDGNAVNGDGCDNACHVEPGFACTTNSPSACQALCSNGQTDVNGEDDITGNADDEECDDGNAANGDGCDNVCHVESGFACTDDSPSACQALCSNGQTDVNGEDDITGNADDEECDDGNAANGDGCDNVCHVESGFACTDDSPSVCQALCSDGYPDLNGPDDISGNADDEQCDDGDLDNGDGCNNVCHIEPGFSCSGTPSLCMPNPPVCGNGIVEAGEECDDGNDQLNDSCGNDCRFLVMPI